MRYKKFQSTHPSWGATLHWRESYKAVKDISIHAPIVGCDAKRGTAVHKAIEFQSTHPSWGATVIFSIRCCYSIISIHAPIVGCDLDEYFVQEIIDNISIHAPIVGCDFHCFEQWSNVVGISIHAPIVGCDSRADKHGICHNNFNPRTHRGVRRRKKRKVLCI